MFFQRIIGKQKRSDIIKYGASIFGIGDDWKGKFDELSDICEVIYLERTESVSTTDIKKNYQKLVAKSVSS